MPFGNDSVMTFQSGLSAPISTLVRNSLRDPLVEDNGWPNVKVRVATYMGGRKQRPVESCRISIPTPFVPSEPKVLTARSTAKHVDSSDLGLRHLNFEVKRQKRCSYELVPSKPEHAS